MNGWRTGVLERGAARLRNEPAKLDDQLFVSHVNPIAAALWSGALRLVHSRTAGEDREARAAELERRAAELRAEAERL